MEAVGVFVLVGHSKRSLNVRSVLLHVKSALAQCSALSARQTCIKWISMALSLVCRSVLRAISQTKEPASPAPYHARLVLARLKQTAQSVLRTSTWSEGSALSAQQVPSSTVKVVQLVTHSARVAVLLGLVTAALKVSLLEKELV
jgi:hypothetical protein